MFWVANLLTDDAPTVLTIRHVQTEAEALVLGVQMAQERGAKEDDATIRRELADEGRYTPEKYSEWAVCLGEIEQPAPVLPSCPQFTCPSCGSHRLEEVMDGVCVSTEVLDVAPGGDLDFGDCSHDDGVVDRYQCLNCGWQVPEATDSEALVAYLGVEDEGAEED
jgi:predicted RNA-binding Zn-ribbon protein involved in translation (DUF1610 family)